MRKWPLTLKVWSAKTSISCETSFKFHRAIFMKLNKYDFCEASATFQDTHQMLRLPRKKRRACIDAFPKYCACENDLPFCDLGAPKRTFRTRLPPLFILWRKGLCRSACVPPNGETLTTQRRRHDDDTTNTMRTQVQPQTPTINGNPSLRIRE